MTTAPEAYSALKALVEASVPADVTALRWQDQDADSNGAVELPETPATFIYSEFLAARSGVIERGGGRGALRHRNPAELVIYVFTPRGRGLVRGDGSGALEIAEALAAVFRAYDLGGIKVTSATAFPGGDGAALKPRGLDSAVDAYFWAAVEVDLYFDLIG